jgi:hypothetical protein
MQKKYEFVARDWVLAGTRRLFRIRAVRDFGEVRRGGLGGYIECAANLCHSGNASGGRFRTKCASSTRMTMEEIYTPLG